MHFCFLRNQPVFKKALPALGAASVRSVQREVLFQQHLAKHNHILFCWCHAQCIATSIHSLSRHSRSPCVWCQLSPFLGCVGGNLRAPSPARLCRQLKVSMLSPSTALARASPKPRPPKIRRTWSWALNHKVILLCKIRFYLILRVFLITYT